MSTNQSFKDIEEMYGAENVEIINSPYIFATVNKQGDIRISAEMRKKFSITHKTKILFVITAILGRPDDVNNPS